MRCGDALSFGVTGGAGDLHPERARVSPVHPAEPPEGVAGAGALLERIDQVEDTYLVGRQD